MLTVYLCVNGGFPIFSHNRHGKRSKVTADDVKLCARRQPHVVSSLYQILFIPVLLMNYVVVGDVSDAHYHWPLWILMMSYFPHYMRVDEALGRAQRRADRRGFIKTRCETRKNFAPLESITLNTRLDVLWLETPHKGWHQSSLKFNSDLIRACWGITLVEQCWAQRFRSLYRINKPVGSTQFVRIHEIWAVSDDFIVF